jgi:hypothetical protein
MRKEYRYLPVVQMEPTNAHKTGACSGRYTEEWGVYSASASEVEPSENYMVRDIVSSGKLGITR